MLHIIWLVMWLFFISETAVFLLAPRLKRIDVQASACPERRIFLITLAVFALWPFSLAFRSPDIRESAQYWRELSNSTQGKWWKAPLLFLSAPVLVALLIGTP